MPQMVPCINWSLGPPMTFLLQICMMAKYGTLWLQATDDLALPQVFPFHA